MGSNCSGLKAGGESYSLAGDKHNKVNQEPHGHTQTAVDLTDAGGGVLTDKQTVNNLEAEESSSSRDVNLQVSQEEKTPVQDESRVETLTVATTTMDESVKSPSTKAGHGHAGVTDADFSKLSNMTEDEANDMVNECWENIERTCDVSPKTNENLAHATGWRVVRLFVSSTFADYHAERELLVKKVIKTFNICQINSHLILILWFIYLIGFSRIA